MKKQKFGMNAIPPTLRLSSHVRRRRPLSSPPIQSSREKAYRKTTKGSCQEKSAAQETPTDVPDAPSPSEYA